MVWQALAQWLFGSRKPARKHAPRKGSRPRRPRLGLECLENRLTPSGISGHVFQDVTGNGLSADDTPVKGAVVELYLDMNHNGRLDSRDGLPVARAVSRDDGSYSFDHLSAGRYFVQELLPFGDVRTAPVQSAYYTVPLSSASNVTGQDFDSYHTPDNAAVTNVYFLITTPAGTTTRVSNLRGNVQQGDSVTAYFTVRAGHTAQVSLVSYIATGPKFDPNTAAQQQVFADATNTFGPGQHSLTVQVPASYFQVDFVLGAAIDHFGPAGSNIFYSTQDRLRSADNGGTNPYVPPGASLSGRIFLDNNSDNTFDTGDQGIISETVLLSGKDDMGNIVNLTSSPTPADGTFSFTGLQPGTYSLSVTLPSESGFAPKDPVAGTVNNNTDGIPSTGSGDSPSIMSILLAAGDNGINYFFFEQPAGAPPPGV